MELEKTSFQVWITERANLVRSKITAYEILLENGINSVPDSSTPTQIHCSFHGADNRPSARYYPSSYGKSDSVHCFKCKERWDAINLHAKYRGIKFMDALSDLEKRFGIKPKRGDFKVPETPVERGSNYKSEKWNDVGNLLGLLEKKLSRIRDKCGFDDYVKFCRVLDNVFWDYEMLGQSTPEMLRILSKVRFMMDEIFHFVDPMMENLDSE